MRATQGPDFIEKTDMKRPHVFILGAGASYAAFPSGDRNGRRLPLMCNLVAVLGLEPLLSKHGVRYGGENFEVLYANLLKGPTKADLVKELEDAIYDYFNEMRLPDEATLYDRLVLSLRDKDVIATFNWDPFLWQACSRNHMAAKPPCTLFLHGNVAVGYCRQHRKKGPAGRCCSVCGQPFTPSKLLYPIDKKNYSQDPFIGAEWRALRNALKNAYILTIFGYGAPSSDVEAVDIMKQAWGKAEDRQYEEIEMIDVKTEEILAQTWSPFIHSHHYQVKASFRDSISEGHPRRSCEAVWNQLMDVQFLDRKPMPDTIFLADLIDWLTPLVQHE